jgi:beta-glucosidase
MRRRDRSRVLVLALLPAVAGGQAVPSTARKIMRPVANAPWMDRAKSPDARARLLLSRMTLEEKFWQLYMTPGDPPRDSAGFAHGAFGVQLLDLRDARDPATSARAAAARADSAQRFFVERTRLGIPAILFEEGVHGLMQDGATVFPQAIGLAATWDTALMARVAGVIAAESRERGVRQLLSPVVNLARDPRWGRVEETYGEDAWLSAAMGAAFSGALEHAGVVATPKHFVANYGDGGRDSYPIALDAATLEDLYFLPFRAALDRGGARSIMASYNSVNGVPATANAELLTATLRRAWKFGGVVIADQSGVGGASVLHKTAASYAESVEQAMRAGLDVLFQSRASDARLFWPAFRDGRIPRAVVDTAVMRVLRLKFALGLFDYPYVGAASDAAFDDSAHSLAVRAAEASLVLLHNNGILPLPASTARIAVLGSAASETPLGGYSVGARRGLSLIEALNRRLAGRDSVRHARGSRTDAPLWRPLPPGMLTCDSAGTRINGLCAEYFANPGFEGPPASRRVDRRIDFNWTFSPPALGLSTDWYSVRWSGFITAADDSLSFAVEGDDGYRLWIDDSLVIDADRKTSYGLREVRIALGGKRRAIRLEYRQSAGPGKIRLLSDAQRRQGSDARDMDEAVNVTRGAEIAIVTVTVDEGEFRDRASLRISAPQQELIDRVAATGTPCVVVVFAGGAVIPLPWLNHTAAVLQAFYSGEGGGEALARALFGDANPAGRLPYTVPRAEGQLPLVYDHLPTGRGDDYVDLTGQPLFPFGFGLSYTQFAYRDLTVTPARAAARDTVHVRFVVRNAGDRAGDEVAQLYVRHVVAPSAQPVLALRGFARVTLHAGEEKVVEMALPASALAVRDARGRRGLAEGDVIVYVGASSRDLRLRAMLHTIGGTR